MTFFHKKNCSRRGVVDSEFNEAVSNDKWDYFSCLSVKVIWYSKEGALLFSHTNDHGRGEMW